MQVAKGQQLDINGAHRVGCYGGAGRGGEAGEVSGRRSKSVRGGLARREPAKASQPTGVSDDRITSISMEKRMSRTEPARRGESAKHGAGPSAERNGLEIAEKVKEATDV